MADDPIAGLLLTQLSTFERKLEVVLTSELSKQWPEYRVLSASKSEVAAPPASPAAYLDSMPAYILYTSGSTSKPKGVLLPAGAFVSSGAGYATRNNMTERDHFLLPFTLAHAVGALLGPGMVLWCGGQLTLLERFSGSGFLQEVRRSRATVTLLFPAQVNLVLAHRESPADAQDLSLRLVMTHEWIEPFWHRFHIPMAMTWGSTESGATGAGSGDSYQGEKGTGYIGLPYGDEEIEAVTPDGMVLPRESIGELCLKHRHNMLEYLSDPAGTAEALRDGWLRTGDLGLVTADGAVVYTGRVKNMIKRAGENISPEEIENVMHELDGFSEAVVFGIRDAVRTEEVAILIRMAAAPRCGPADVHRFLSAKISRSKLPRYYRITHDELPRLGVGKFDRTLIARTFDSDTYWDVQRPNADPSAPSSSNGGGCS